MFFGLLGMMSADMAIDLGTANTVDRALRDGMADAGKPGGAERALRGLDRPGTHERKPPKTIVLDTYSSESPIYGEQEGSA